MFAPNFPTPRSDSDGDVALPAGSRLARVLSKVGLVRLSEQLVQREIDQDFVRIIQDAEVRSAGVSQFTVPLVPTFTNRIDGMSAEVRGLSVSYPTELLDEFFTLEARAILARGYQGSEFRYALLNSCWPHFVYAFRPSVSGEAAVVIDGQPEIVVPSCYLTVHPNHLWKMVKTPGLGYPEGVHHDASFGPLGAETRRILLEVFRRNGGNASQFDSLPSAEELGASPEVVAAIGELFKPITSELQKLGETVLNIPAVRDALRSRQARGLLTTRADDSGKLPDITGLLG